MAGAEAAKQLTERGIPVVVFDQNTLPYGKIEDGLPKWHSKLRDKEENRINKKLAHPLVTYVPSTQLGKEVDFKDVVEKWGFSAVLLATGAWKDRPLPIEGIGAYVNKGLYYQNPFIYWYNHFHEPNFAGQTYETPDNTTIIGGGLASLDVAKAIMFQNVERALKERGYQENMFTLDRSIAKVLDKHNLKLADLGLKGCTIYYRRRIKDMPLSTQVTDTPAALLKAQKIQEKILKNYQSKYLFNIQPCNIPVNTIVDNDQLVGLQMQRTAIKNNKVVPILNSEYEVRSSLVISSIGSIPEPIAGIPMQWQTYETHAHELCRIEGYANAFALGNAVTGRGNILESLKHSRAISTTLAEQSLTNKELQQKIQSKEQVVSEQIQQIIPILSPVQEQTYQAIQKKVKHLQKQAQYNGDYQAWVVQKLPVRLESMLGGH